MIKPTVEVVPATEEDIIRWYGPIEFRTQWHAMAVRKGSLVVGIGGVIEVEPGVWFAFLEVPKRYLRPIMVRHIRDGIRTAIQKGATVIKAACDPCIERSDALLRHLGFVETNEEINDQVLWVWQQ